MSNPSVADPDEIRTRATHSLTYSLTNLDAAKVHGFYVFMTRGFPLTLADSRIGYLYSDWA